ncbi:MAG TPA: nucleotidyltransferase family protein [Vicinamibacterales bacterium]|nr:nucleotidyltransferase family protein [Vicinamibacterales bacterium]
MSLPVAILAGGLATRLKPVTERIPKSLVEVAGRPFAEHQVELLRSHGLTDIVFLAGHLGEMLREALGDGSRWNVSIRYVFDGPRPLGTGGALRAALPHLAGSFLVLYGDSYLECDYTAIARAFVASGKSALMTVCRNDDRWDRSNVHYEDGRIVAYNKDARTPDMHHIDYGLGALKADALTRYAADEAFDLSSVYRTLLAEDELAAFDVPGRFYEIGSHAGLEETRRHLSGRGTHAR